MILQILDPPVPPEGRYLTKTERKTFQRKTGFTLDASIALLVPVPGGFRLYGDEGCTRLITERPPGTRNAAACLNKPVPPTGRYLSESESMHGREAGLQCSPHTFIRPRPDGVIVKWDRNDGYVGVNAFLPYQPKPAGRKLAPPPVIDADGCKRIACLTYLVIPPEGRYLTYPEESALKRLAPEIKYDSYYILPAPDRPPGEGAYLQDAPYAGNGNYLLVPPPQPPPKIIIGTDTGVTVRTGRSRSKW